MDTQNIFLYGVPGSGKTTIANALSQLLHYENVELDAVRTEAQTGTSHASDPFLFEYTTTAWQQFGELSATTAVKGFLAVRTALQPYVLQTIQNCHQPIIAEAAFVDPTTLNSLGQCFLITCTNKTQHYKQFFLHRDVSAATDQQFTAAGYIEEYLIQEAKRCNIPVINNAPQLSQTTDEIVHLLKQ